MVSEQIPTEDPEQMKRDGYFLYEVWLPDLTSPVMQENLARHNWDLAAVIDETETMNWIEDLSSWIFDED